MYTLWNWYMAQWDTDYLGLHFLYNAYSLGGTLMPTTCFLVIWHGHRWRTDTLGSPTVVSTTIFTVTVKAWVRSIMNYKSRRKTPLAYIFGMIERKSDTQVSFTIETTLSFWFEFVYTDNYINWCLMCSTVSYIWTICTLLSILKIFRDQLLYGISHALITYLSRMSYKLE